MATPSTPRLPPSCPTSTTCTSCLALTPPSAAIVLLFLHQNQTLQLLPPQHHLHLCHPLDRPFLNMPANARRATPATAPYHASWVY
ncbi:uncharacterized protein ACA1_332550 [Acanthamoeba castellanii str. Neff]|uniref:Uncharacterized protein n=1 Tax=Acanthamoeba castellanii (strain ATCC 30010 / Neff) TaxID=1257118 RepID=L8GN99_ACACF|nr:uncharacterized protein ACA1_332550 [Acanthamoeba castellanii str. Neff]ELR13691.1 hypothetical protein ACA1_332550 [Acanthamoeba castellanii str. Neff]